MFIEQIFGTQRPILEDIERFVLNFKEDSRVEFKRSVSENIEKNLLGEVVAFANSEGGILLIGITDSKRKIVGCEESSETIENPIMERIEPSMAGLFVIESVHISEGSAVIIVEVEKSPEIHAVRIKKNNKNEINGAYIYYYRSAMSTRIMTPAVLNRISAIKKDLRYNFNYRVSIFISINKLISSLVWMFNFRTNNNVDENILKSYSQKYLYSFSDSEKALKTELVSLLSNTRLEFLYSEIWNSITEFYAEILEIERDTPHTTLTF